MEFTPAQVFISLQALRASRELSSSTCPSLPAALTWLERAQPPAEGVSSLIAQGHVRIFAGEQANRCGQKILRAQMLCQQPVSCSRQAPVRWQRRTIKPGIQRMSRTACTMLKHATRWALLTALVSTKSSCAMPVTGLCGPWTPTHARDCATSIPLDGSSGRPDMCTSGYTVDTVAYPCCPWPLQRKHSQRSHYSLSDGLGQHSATAGVYPMHGARFRLGKSAGLRSGCKHDLGADAQYILCPDDPVPQPQDSTLCTVNWVPVHMSHHAASALTHTAWDCSYGSSADRLKAHNYSYFVDKASCSIVPLLTRRSRWRYLVAHFAHPSVMPPQRPRDGKSRATLCRQGTRLGKRQRAEARELERMRCHNRVALPTAPPRSSAGSSTDLPQRPAVSSVNQGGKACLVHTALRQRQPSANQEDCRTWRHIVLRCCLCNVSIHQQKKAGLGQHGQSPSHRPMSQWSRELVPSH